MLATEAARYPPAGNRMPPAFQSRGHANGGPNGYPPPGSSNPNDRNGARQDLTNGDQRGLFPPPAQPPQPEGAQNIMNRRANPESSLYRICLNLRKRLAEVPGFQEHIAEMEEEEREANDSSDPVTTMWNCLRHGYPLLTLYNAFRPPVPLLIDPNISEAKIPKHAAFKFLQACMGELKFPASEMFLITDLYGENTTGFVKVTKVVNRVLDMLESRGLLMERKPSAPDSVSSRPQTQTTRQRIVNELVETERDYINHLENLQHFKKELEHNGVLAGDVIHDIFLNLDGLLEFQRRFQVRLEQQYSSPESLQQWGKLFSHYADPFKVYIPFIANQDTCVKTLGREWEKLKAAPIPAELHGIVETQSVLLSFVTKPFQRLTKYPMLLHELRRKGGYDQERMDDLQEGAEKVRSILDESNEVIAREIRREAVEELQLRVEDWKGHKIDHFGELLLNGTYTVVKGEGAKEAEREYKVYLFERILLCCKEINVNKQKNKMLGNKALVDKKGKPRLQLKGRIFMQNVTDVLTFSRSDRTSFTVQIFWKGDPGVENFVIRFPDEGTMTKWRETVQAQKRRLSESRSSGGTIASATGFSWTSNQPPPDNPYLNRIEVDEEDSPSTNISRSTFPVSRNGSNNSLRSFPGPNITSSSRPPHPRMPMADSGIGFVPPLSVNTNVSSNAQSPGDFAGGSYFSPAVDSPISTSTRASSQASMYSFNRQNTPVGGWAPDNNKHRTAPAMGRAPSREGYTRPSIPGVTNPQNPNQSTMTSPQSRLRSASTPDMPNGNDPRARRQPTGPLSPAPENVPVPPIPQNMRTQGNRNQTSPTNNQLPIRNANPSPNYDARGQRVASRPDNYASRQPPVGYGTPYASSTKSEQSSISTEDDKVPWPPQIKVKICYDDSNHYVTIVVGNNIKYRTLADRIDSKMLKITTQAISKGSAKLASEDAEGDIITIQSDDDLQIALEDWAMRNDKVLRTNPALADDFELIWQEKSS